MNILQSSKEQAASSATSLKTASNNISQEITVTKDTQTTVAGNTNAQNSIEVSKQTASKMSKVMKSEEAKRVIEKNLKNLDENALTDKGLIKSYGIDYDSVRHNPMGGVMFNVYVNNNKDMMVYFTLTKDYKNDLTNAGGGITKELSMLLGR